MIASHIPVNTLTATRTFAKRVADAELPQKAILFGSRARGTEHDESDADVAIIFKGAAGQFIKTKMAMNDIAYDILLDTSIRIQPLPIWEAEWAHPENFSDPHLLQSIARNGVTL